MSWIFRSSQIHPNNKYYKDVNMSARKVAILVTESGHSLTTQHYPGQHNIIADYLSYEQNNCAGERNGELHPLSQESIPNTELTNRFHFFLPQLLPQNLQVLQLDSNIT